MTMAFLGEMLWKSALIASAALLLLRLLRAQAPADRANVLRVSVAVLLALPLIAVAAPAMKIAVLPAEVSPIAAPLVGDVTPAPVIVGTGSEPPIMTLPERTWDNPGPLVAILYAGGVLMVLARLLAGLWTLRRWTATATPVRDGAWLSTLERLRVASGASERVRLLETVECGSPLSWGFLRPVILIDRDRIESGEDAEGILAHELAHIVRRDWLMLMLMHVATALFWFNPLVWWLQREAIQQSEEAADAYALECAEPAKYAQMLLSYADYATSGIPANCMAPAAGLTRRVKAILAHGLSAARPKRRWALAAMLACVGIAAPISAAKLVAATAEKADEAKAPHRAKIMSEEWAEAAGVPVAPVSPRAPMAPMAPASPVTPRVAEAFAWATMPPPPAPPAAPLPPANPVLAAPPAASILTLDADEIEEIAEARREAARHAAEVRREAASEARQAQREAAQEQREAERERHDAAREIAAATREAARDTHEWSSDMADLGARIANSVRVSVDARAIAAGVHDGMAEGMRGGAEGMERGAREMREEARKLRDPAYRKQVIAKQRAQNWGHVSTDTELVEAIPKMERGADKMVEGARKMREGAVRAAEGQERARIGMRNGARQMMASADRMDAGAERMREAAANFRKPEYRRQKVAEARARGDDQTEEEMIRAIPGLERGARNMKREAETMREQARQMAST